MTHLITKIMTAGALALTTLTLMKLGVGDCSFSMVHAAPSGPPPNNNPPPPPANNSTTTSTTTTTGTTTSSSTATAATNPTTTTATVSLSLSVSVSVSNPLVSTIQTANIPVPTPSTTGLCNGLQEACALPYTKMSFVGAHNAGGFNMVCTEAGQNTCGVGAAELVCGYDNQGYDATALLDMGVRWMDLAVVGYNPGDPTQAYIAHNSGTTLLGLSYGIAAIDFFNQIASFLQQNPNELITVWLKPGERDTAIKSASGPNGYAQFFAQLQASLAGTYLAGANAPFMTVGQLIQEKKNLVVMGWDTIPPEVGVSDAGWVVDSWADPKSAADLATQMQNACGQGKPVILETILPFNGACVLARKLNEVVPVYSGLYTSCASQTSVLSILLDYVTPDDAVFGIVANSIRGKAAAFKARK